MYVKKYRPDEAKYVKEFFSPAICILLAIFWLILAVLLFFAFTDKTDDSFHGFALDSQGNVYVGKKRIEVYENGVLCRKISPLAKSYSFTVDNDLLILETETEIATMDLSGEIKQRKSVDSAGSSFKKQNTFIAPNGTQYRAVHTWGFDRILREDGACIWHMLWKDYLFKVIFFANIILFAAVMGPRAIWLYVKRHRTTGP